MVVLMVARAAVEADRETAREIAGGRATTGRGVELCFTNQLVIPRPHKCVKGLPRSDRAHMDYGENGREKKWWGRSGRAAL